MSCTISTVLTVWQRAPAPTSSKNLTGASRRAGGVEIVLGDDRGEVVLGAADPRGRAEHRAAGRVHRGEGGEAAALRDVVVDRLHAAAQQVGLVPEAGAAAVAQ